MVSFQELRDAKASHWMTAGSDMKNIAGQCQRVVDDIHNNGVMPLSESWTDHTGSVAVDTLRSVAGRAEVTGILARSVVDPLDTLAHAIAIAQNELENAIHYAEQRGLKVDAKGSVSIPDGVGDPNAARQWSVQAVCGR